MELVTKNYWWPEVTRDVGRYVEGCDLCQRMKNRVEEVAGKLKLRGMPEMSKSLTVDFIFIFSFLFSLFFFFFFYF